jgi:hypothetical protein
LKASIDFNTPTVPASALDVSRDQVIFNCIEHDLRNLCPRAVVKKYECVALAESRELVADPLNWKFLH